MYCTVSVVHLDVGVTSWDAESRARTERYVLEAIATLFVDDGYVNPMYHLLATTPRIELVVVSPTRFESEIDKAAFSMAIAECGKRFGAVGSILATEAWTVIAKPGADLRKFRGKLEDHPDHREVLFVVSESTRESAARSWWREIHRDESGKVKLAPAWEATPAKDHAGRFVGLLGKVN